MGFLADAASFEEYGILVEPQTHLQDLYLDEVKFEEQKEEASSCKDKGAFAAADLPQCNVEHGFHARYAGKRQKGKKPKCHGRLQQGDSAVKHRHEPAFGKSDFEIGRAGRMER